MTTIFTINKCIKILKKKSNSNNSYKILNWLYFNPGTSKQLNKLLLDEIKSDKKSKLVVIQIYKNIIEEQSHILKKKEGKKKFLF